MISSVCFVPQGVAKRIPETAHYTEEQLDILNGKLNGQQQLAKAGLEKAQEKSGQKKSKKANGHVDAMAIEQTPSQPAEDPLAIFNLDTYDDDDDKEENDDGEETGKEKGASFPLFQSSQKLAYYDSGEEDPYIELKDEADEDATERQELEILPQDHLVLAARTEDDVSYLEVYVYENDQDNLFVHHDIMLPAFPLCVEWLDFDVAPERAGIRGNFAAIGMFQPDIEIWDLDLLDAIYPYGLLAGTDASSSTRSSQKKSTTPAKKHTQLSGHSDAVLTLSWNRLHRHMLASGSADRSIRLWDLSASPSACVRVFEPHRDKVQRIQWHPTDATVLLSGSYDTTACVFDTRTAHNVARFQLDGELECLQWDPFQSALFYASTDRGTVSCHDQRQPQKPLWTLHAHHQAVSALDVHRSVPNLLLTASTDRHVKVWDLAQPQQPHCVLSRDMQIGQIFSASFAAASQEAPSLVTLGGHQGIVKVWNCAENNALRRLFEERLGRPVSVSSHHLPLGRSPYHEGNPMEDEDDDEDDDEEGEGEPMNEDMSEDMSEEEPVKTQSKSPNPDHKQRSHRLKKPSHSK